MFPHPEIQIGYLCKDITKERLFLLHAIKWQMILICFLYLFSRKHFLKQWTILVKHGTEFVNLPWRGEWLQELVWSKRLGGEKPFSWYQIPVLEWSLSEFRGWQWYIIKAKYLLMGVAGCSGGQKKRMPNSITTKQTRPINISTYLYHILIYAVLECTLLFSPVRWYRELTITKFRLYKIVLS